MKVTPPRTVRASGQLHPASAPGARTVQFRSLRKPGLALHALLALAAALAVLLAFGPVTHAQERSPTLCH